MDEKSKFTEMELNPFPSGDLDQYRTADSTHDMPITSNECLLKSVSIDYIEKNIENNEENKKRSKFKINSTQKTFVVGFILILIQLVYAGYSVISVLYVKDYSLNVVFLTMTRVIIASPLSIILALSTEGRFSFNKITKKEYAYFFCMGITSAALNPIMYLLVVTYTSATYTAILSQLIPVFSSIFSIALKVEPIPSISNKQTILRICGVVVCISFAASVSAIGFVTPPQGIMWRDWLIGTVIGVVNNLVYSLYMVLQLKIFYKNPKSYLKTKPFTINCLSTCFGSSIFIIPALIYIFVAEVNLDIPPISALPILYAGVLNSTICFGLLTYCIKNSSAIISSCLYSVQIVSSMILLFIFANEVIFVSQYICSAFVIIGALMVILSPLLKS